MKVTNYIETKKNNCRSRNGPSKRAAILSNIGGIFILKKFILYLKFKFNWAFYILSGNPK